MMTDSNAPVKKLPSELLLKILQHILDSPDATPIHLLHCALVCRAWSYYALQLIWYKPVILRPQTWSKFSKTLALSHQQTYIPYAPLVRRINLSAVPEFISNDSLNILSVCKQLDRLTLTGCTHITPEGLIEFLNQGVGKYLLSLDLSEMKYMADDTIIAIANSCRHLQGLNLSINPTKEEEWSGITDDSIIYLAQHCKDLRRVSDIQGNVLNHR
jgi:F-box and leucine-rich repeat protein GRR1